MKINTTQPIQLKENTQSADMTKQGKLKKACQDFEAIILKQMLSTMRKSIPKGGLFESGYADEMYQSLNDQELAQGMADSGGTGIADILYDQLSGKITSSTTSTQNSNPTGDGS